VGVTHYEVLGVAVDASTDEIRSAYLGLARRHHPDFDDSDPDGERMRELNLAWRTLSDTGRRSSYDRQIGVGDELGSDPHAPLQPSTEFRPYFEVDEDDDDTWRYEPDVGDPATVPPVALLVAPPAAVVIGVAVMLISLPSGNRTLMAVGLMFLALSVLLFVLAPLVAMFRGIRVEARVSRERERL